ncbi:hypothetical protein BH09VER1_BH09VER1_17750 [soil metagenome]
MGLPVCAKSELATGLVTFIASGCQFLKRRETVATCTEMTLHMYWLDWVPFFAAD